MAQLANTFVTSAKTTATSLCKGGIPGGVASVLHGFQPASSFCSAKFPVPTITTTVTAQTTTLTATASTVTITTTASTSSTTQTDATITSILTDTFFATPTVTVTATAAPARKKRHWSEGKLDERGAAKIAVRPAVTDAAEKRSPNAANNPQLSSYLAAITAREYSFVASVCTCLETQPIKTVTSTPSTTQTSTPHATQTGQ